MKTVLINTISNIPNVRVFDETVTRESILSAFLDEEKKYLYILRTASVTETNGSLEIDGVDTLTNAQTRVSFTNYIYMNFS